MSADRQTLLTTSLLLTLTNVGVLIRWDVGVDKTARHTFCCVAKIVPLWISGHMATWSIEYATGMCERGMHWPGGPWPRPQASGLWASDGPAGHLPSAVSNQEYANPSFRPTRS